MINRTEKEEFFLDLAERNAKQGSCQRRNYGAVIVDKKGHLISSGYTGAPKGQSHCEEIGTCWREKNNIPSGSNYNKCRSVHAEMNAMLQAGRDAEGCNIYISGIDAKTGEKVSSEPCYLCSKMIVNSGIEKIIIRKKEGGFETIKPNDMYLKLEERELGKNNPRKEGLKLTFWYMKRVLKIKGRKPCTL